MVRKRFVLIFVGLVCLGLSGCGRATSEQSDPITDISNREAVSVSVIQDVQDTEILLGEGVIIEWESIHAVQDNNLEEGSCFVLESVVRNKDYEFLRTGYYEEMAQYPYRNQIYIKGIHQDNIAVIYDTSEAYWINEMGVNDNYLYWMEHIHGEGDTCYRIMQYQLDSGEVSCIAERYGEDVYEPCLEASNRFLTWYDIFRDGSVEIVVFDVEKQEFMEREDGKGIDSGFVTLYGLYERLKLVDDCITYFLEDEEGKLYVRRENLCTGQTSTLLLGDKGKYRKLAGCFSDEQYMGWHTEYGWGSYYFYNTDKGELYSWDVKKDNMYVFSKFFSSGRLYINNRQEDNVYVWDLPTSQAYRQNYGEGTGMQFGQYGEGKLDLKVEYADRIERFTLCDDDLFEE